MKEDLLRTGLVAAGIISSVDHIPTGQYVIKLIVSGMDSVIGITLEKGHTPDPKQFELGKLIKMKFTISQWKGNTYFNEVPA